MDLGTVQSIVDTVEAEGDMIRDKRKKEQRAQKAELLHRLGASRRRNKSSVDVSQVRRQVTMLMDDVQSIMSDEKSVNLTIYEEKKEQQDKLKDRQLNRRRKHSQLTVVDHADPLTREHWLSRQATYKPFESYASGFPK